MSTPKCGKRKQGRKIGRVYVDAPGTCSRPVKEWGDRCWQHGGPKKREEEVEVETCDDCPATTGLDRYNDYGGGIAVLCWPCAEKRFD